MFHLDIHHMTLQSFSDNGCSVRCVFLDDYLVQKHTFGRHNAIHLAICLQRTIECVDFSDSMELRRLIFDDKLICDRRLIDAQRYLRESRSSKNILIFPPFFHLTQPQFMYTFRFPFNIIIYFQKLTCLFTFTLSKQLLNSAACELVIKVRLQK